MNEDEQYIADSIHLWVWSGYYSAEEMDEMVDDVLDGECDVAMLKGLIAPELQRKREAERHWPAKTDCERLDALFEQLHEEGICALDNAGYTMSDGFAEIAEALHEAPEGHYHGYCFYHGQDIERSIQEGGLMLAFGAMSDDPEQALQVAQRICQLCRAAGFEVHWDGSVKQRIDLVGFTWQRRHRH